MSHRRSVSGPRGFTLLEVLVVVVLSSILTLGLVGFYLNSQAMWMDASTQVLAQRDATALLDLIRSRSQAAAHATVLPTADSLNHVLILLDSSNSVLERFYWNPADSLVHHDIEGGSSGPVVPTIVERFHIARSGVIPLFDVDTLRMRSTSGQRVQMSTTVGLYNAP